MRKFFLYSAIVLAVIISGCSEQLQLKDAVRINIVGYVTNLESDLPLADVEVTLETQKGTKKTKTDETGKYVFNDLVSGFTYFVSFEKEGFMSDALLLGGIANVNELGSLPYDENFNGSIQLDSLGAELNTTFYFNNGNNTIVAKNQDIRIIFPCQAGGNFKVVDDIIVKTDANGKISVKNLPLNRSITLNATINDGTYKFDGNIANNVVAGSNSASYYITLQKIILNSFGILSSNILKDNGSKVEDFIISNDIKITFTSQIDTTGYTTGGTNVLSKAGFTLTGHTIKVTIDVPALTTITVELVPNTTNLSSDTEYTLQIPNLKPLNSSLSDDFGGLGIEFKTAKKGS